MNCDLLSVVSATHSTALKLGVVAVVGIAVVLLLMIPRVRAIVFPPLEPIEDVGGPSIPMTRGRMIVAYGVMAFIVGGSFLELARDTEHWPWSNYPMYSGQEQAPGFEDFRLYGVRTDDPSVEVPLYNDGRYIQPFDPSRMARVLGTIYGDPALRNGLDTGLRDCLMRYEELRRAGKHDGPELSGLRMYRVYYTLDVWGANIDKPDWKQLVAQVSLTDKGKS